MQLTTCFSQEDNRKEKLSIRKTKNLMIDYVLMLTQLGISNSHLCSLFFILRR